MILPAEWQGTTPYYLVIQTDVTTPGIVEDIVIDLDEHQWLTTYADLMRRPGIWILLHKEMERAPLMVVVYDGEQPYYTARHVGITGSGGGNEITAYGIGKKLIDGTVVRLWAMPNGIVCGGDDVDAIGVKLVHALGPR